MTYRTTDQYPKGALKTIEELRDALLRADGNGVFYKVYGSHGSQGQIVEARYSRGAHIKYWPDRPLEDGEPWPGLYKDSGSTIVSLLFCPGDVNIPAFKKAWSTSSSLIPSWLKPIGQRLPKYLGGHNG